MTASYKRIMVCGHPPGQHRPECARRILTPLLHRAYRRPVDARELDRLLSLVQLAQGRGDSFEAGVRVAITAVLMSPNFLFRIERDPPGQSARAIGGTELASRLSYFFWSSMPDDELLGLAEKGRLRDPAVLHAQVRRMMADPKARALVENFSGQWLQTRNLQALKPDAVKFPEFDAELRDLMRTETEMFFQAVVSEDRSVLDFLDGRFTFLNERLAKFYGIDGVTGREFRRHVLDGRQRAGVLTQASVLTVSSYPTRTSPVIRGKWVLENLLNAPPPPPPAEVPVLDEKASGVTVSLRQQLEEHRANPACAGCHSQMDPLGFGLENYDAIGRWRTVDGKFPIDASGVLPNGKTFSGAEELRSILKADSARFVRALTEKMLTYALGRGLEVYDRPAVEKIANSVERNGFRFSQLIHATVESVPFQMRRGSAEGVSQR
jgi:PAS domain-containing protein